jgi:hypothetical protein
MNCLECSLSPETDLPRTAVGSCAYCGAGVCLDHARLVTFRPQPAGVVPESRGGARRILCPACYASPAPEASRARAASVPGPDARAIAAR